MSPKEFMDTILAKHPTMQFKECDIEIDSLYRRRIAHKVYAYLPEHADAFQAPDLDRPWMMAIKSQYILSEGKITKARSGLFGQIPNRHLRRPISSPFKQGDIISGNDRSYARSIYRFEGFEDNKAVLTWLAYDGTMADLKLHQPEHYKTLVPLSYLDESHIATWQDIMEAVRGGKPRKVAVDTETAGLGGKPKISLFPVDGPAHMAENYDVDAVVRKMAGEEIKHPVTEICQLGRYQAPAEIHGTGCDCGAEKAGTHAHAHWCSTKQEIKS